jgi:hypothetical protein
MLFIIRRIEGDLKIEIRTKLSTGQNQRGYAIVNWYERGLCSDYTRIWWIPGYNWQRTKGCFGSRLAARFFALGSMDLGQQQDSDTEPVFYPVPHSHWFPRPIAFRAYNPSGGRSQQNAGPRGTRRLHIQVLRPVSLTLTFNSHCWYMVTKMKIGLEEFASSIIILSWSMNLFGSFWAC